MRKRYKIAYVFVAVLILLGLLLLYGVHRGRVQQAEYRRFYELQNRRDWVEWNHDSVARGYKPSTLPVRPLSPAEEAEFQELRRRVGQHEADRR